MRVEKNVPFKKLTTLKVGGVAHKVCYLESQEELVESIKNETEEYVILGGGSNVLAPDGEFTKTIYIPSFVAIQTEENRDGEVFVTAEAGVVWDTLVAYTTEKGWWGFENLSAIPGTIGGAVFQNIGAYGAVLSDTIESVRFFDAEEGEIKTIQKDGCEFGYRTSIFKKNSPRHIILSACFRLKKHGQPNIGYKDLADEFANDPSPRISAIRTAVISIRRKKFPNLDEYGTAGSFFLNPVVSKENAEKIKSRYPSMPLFNMPEGGVKIPIAWLLDYRHGVIDIRNYKEGGAFTWDNQTLVLVTKENATANDVLKLAQIIKKEIKEKTSIEINFEVICL